MNKKIIIRPTLNRKVGFLMKKILIILGVIILILIYNNEDKKYLVIPEESIRYRIIPNSNSVEDINAKEQIQKSVETDLKKIMEANSIEETRENIINNLENIKQNIEITKKNINYDKDVKVNYGLNYFPEKNFKGVTYEEGYYESLVITLGEGKGDNWWCVLFPPLCMLEFDEVERSDIEYKTFVGEILDRYMNN